MMYLTSREVKQKVFYADRSGEGESSVYPVISFLIETCGIESNPQYRTPAETQMLSDILEWGSETQCNSVEATPVLVTWCFDENLVISVLDSSWNC